MNFLIDSLQIEPSDNQDYTWKSVQVLNSYLSTKASVKSVGGLDDQIQLFQKDVMLEDLCCAGAKLDAVNLGNQSVHLAAPFTG